MGGAPQQPRIVPGLVRQSSADMRVTTMSRTPFVPVSPGVRLREWKLFSGTWTPKANCPNLCLWTEVTNILGPVLSGGLECQREQSWSSYLFLLFL